jgi:hypothetical protein
MQLARKTADVTFGRQIKSDSPRWTSTPNRNRTASTNWRATAYFGGRRGWVELIAFKITSDI